MAATTLDDLKHLLALIYMIPSWILYFIILYIIFFSSQKHNYTGSFYWLFGFSAINNLIQSSTYYIIYRFTRIPLLNSYLETWPQESLWYIIVYTAMYYSAYAIHTYSLALSFNRITVFLFKNRHVLFWKRNLKFILAFCVLGPLVFVWTFPFIEIRNQPSAGWAVYIVPTITDFAPWFQRSRNLFIEILFTSITSLIMNLCFLFGIVNWRYSAAHHITHLDVMMFVFNMLIFSTEAFSCMQQVGFGPKLSDFQKTFLILII